LERPCPAPPKTKRPLLPGCEVCEVYLVGKALPRAAEDRQAVEGSDVSYERGIPVVPRWEGPAPRRRQEYLVHKKQHSPLGLPPGPRHSPTVGSYMGGVGNPAGGVPHWGGPALHCPSRRYTRSSRPHLAERINEIVLKSQSPHKIVNFFC